MSRRAVTPVERQPRIAVVSKRSAYREKVEEQKDARIRRLLAKGDPSVARPPA